MDTAPLLTHAAPDAPVGYRARRAISAAEFLAEAAELAECLPPGKHVLNACTDRYEFAVGLAACLISQRVSLLPSTHTPEVIQQLAHFAPDAICLTDETDCSIELPRYVHSRAAARAGSSVPFRIPQIPAEQLAAIVFTSGSTGTPLPYKKTWGRLVRCVRDGAAELGLLDGRCHTLVGTVPAQHMYGFESTVLAALQSGNVLSSDRPFYPADVCASLSSMPRPRALVTTPVHLRALLAAGVELPPVDLIVSATAPLPRQLAQQAEEQFHARLLEIYGSTETGQIAMRRTSESIAFKLWRGVRLRADNGQIYAHGGHVEQMTPLCDVLEITAEDQFVLHGRTADLVNVAGKRSSFGYLNAQLNAIPGVSDGIFFLRDSEGEDLTGVARLAAAAVAPGLTAAALMKSLRRRIDPVFLPRPLLLVDRLPRNATGKLPQQALQSLIDQHARSIAVPKRSAKRRP
jgi:acyl-coenzyme A synthetase/AMP-(fatty) acid ligase